MNEASKYLFIMLFCQGHLNRQRKKYIKNGTLKVESRFKTVLRNFCHLCQLAVIKYQNDRFFK